MTIRQQLVDSLQQCFICKQLGHRYQIERLPQSGILWGTRHDDGKICKWGVFYQEHFVKKTEKPTIIQCPACSNTGRVNSYFANERTQEVTYLIIHGLIDGTWGKQRRAKSNRCYIYDKAQRDIVLKALGRYIEPEQQPQQVQLQQQQQQPQLQVQVQPQPQQQQVQLAKTGRRPRVPRIMCPICNKPGAVKYYLKKIDTFVYEHLDEPPVHEYTSPTTGKKYYTHRRCNAGKRKQKLMQKEKAIVISKPKPKQKHQQPKIPQPLPDLELYECPKCQKFGTIHEYHTGDKITSYYMRHGPYPQVPRCSITIAIAEALKQKPIKRKNHGAIIVNCPQCNKDGTLSKRWDITRTPYARMEIIHPASQSEDKKTKKHGVTRQTKAYEDLKKIWEDTWSIVKKKLK